jgi:adenylate cyclase
MCSQKQGMESSAVYIPMDRRWALASGEELPDRTNGAALFADISGFTPLTEALVEELGPRRGADELTRQLNLVYETLIARVHRYRGSVITFSGDAITCWLDGDDGLRATACGLAMQEAMRQFAQVETPSGLAVSLAMKAAVATGPVRRFLVGDPEIQMMDVLAGATLDRMAAAEHQAERGEVLVEAGVISQLCEQAEIADWREDVETGDRYAVVAGLACQVEEMPWSSLPPGTLSEDQVRPWLLPPVWDRLVAGQGRYLAELRPGVALFVRFGGLDYDEDDAAGEKLDEYLRWVQKVLARYEGYMFQLTLGDKGCYLYGAYGAPLAHDDDPARAVAAALELQVLPREMDFVTGLQMGISQGRMRAGAYGGSARGTYGVLGDEVNLAARLMGKAESGQILVSQHIAEAVSKSYRIEHMGLIEVKGKQKPLPVSQVLGRRRASQQRPAVSYAYRLVGRENELARMEHLLESVLDGKGRILRLEGAAGIGKSHLAAEFIERAVQRGFRVALGGCQSISQDIAYYPWRQAFGALFGLSDEPAEGSGLEGVEARQMAQVEAALREASPGWLLRLPLLGDLLDLPIPDNETTAAFDPRLRQEALFALAVEIVQTWARERPLLLLIEDVHWMDEASQGLTLALGRTVASAPVLLALVHRPPIREDRPLLPELTQLPIYEHLGLDELSSEGVAVLVSHRLQGQLAPLALDLIQAQAHGNPFFVEELVSALRESGQLRRDEDGTWVLSDTMLEALRAANCLTRENGQWILAPGAQLSAADLGIPDSIHGIVLSRLDRLPEAHKLTLKTASVIGRVFEFDVLEQAHPVRPGREALQEQMTALEARDFARLEIPPPRLAYMFKHNTTQEVAYDTLLEEQRRELHYAVGEVLENLQPEAVENLAYHYSRSEARDKTLFYLDKAARKTQAEYANETALNYYNQALALEERWEWHKGQVDVLYILGRREEEEAGLRALEQSSKPVEEAAPEVNYLWARYHEVVSDYEEAKAAGERARRAYQMAGDQDGEARCLALLGLAARKEGDYAQAQAWYGEALTLLDEATQPRETALTLNGLGMVYMYLGEYAEARLCHERALALQRAHKDRLGEAKSLNDLGVISRDLGDLTGSLAYHQQALTERRAIGDRWGEGGSLFNLGLGNHELGDYVQAEEYYRQAIEIQRAIGDRWGEAITLNSYGVLRQDIGDLTQARNLLEQALALSRSIGDDTGEVMTLGNLGAISRDLNDFARAESLLENTLALARKLSHRFFEGYALNYMGLLHLATGAAERARDCATAALTIRRELEQRPLQADDLALLAMAHLELGEREMALGHAREALAILDECGAEGPEAPQRDYYTCYRVLAATGHLEQARQALQEAYDLVIARAEKIIAPAMRQSFLENVAQNREIIAAWQTIQATQ